MTVTSQLQTAPYLREQRQFPFENVTDLAGQVDQAYIDIANKVNVRTIGIYATNFPIITGDSWFLNGQPNRQQSLKQVYPLIGLGNIPHGINFASVSQVSANSYGSFTDGINWYGAIYASNVPIAGQVSFYITPTNIVVIAGAGAPTITNGSIILEWISQF
jgi:hypothetical protein